MRRLSLSNRLALLFAACTAVVSLFAGVLFSRASEAHFIELDQQLLDGKLIGLRRALQDVQPAQREARLADELSRQADLALRIGRRERLETPTPMTLRPADRFVGRCAKE